MHLFICFFVTDFVRKGREEYPSFQLSLASIFHHIFLSNLKLGIVTQLGSIMLLIEFRSASHLLPVSRLGIAGMYSLSRNSQIPFFNPFPNKPWFLCVCITSLLKTLWAKEKLLVTGFENFLPFSSNLKLSSANFFSLEEF